MHSIFLTEENRSAKAEYVWVHWSKEDTEPKMWEILKPHLETIFSNPHIEMTVIINKIMQEAKAPTKDGGNVDNLSHRGKPICENWIYARRSGF